MSKNTWFNINFIDYIDDKSILIKEFGYFSGFRDTRLSVYDLDTCKKTRDIKLDFSEFPITEKKDFVSVSHYLPDKKILLLGADDWNLHVEIDILTGKVSDACAKNSKFNDGGKRKISQCEELCNNELNIITEKYIDSDEILGTLKIKHQIHSMTNRVYNHDYSKMAFAFTEGIDSFAVYEYPSCSGKELEVSREDLLSHKTNVGDVKIYRIIYDDNRIIPTVALGSKIKYSQDDKHIFLLIGGIEEQNEKFDVFADYDTETTKLRKSYYGLNMAISPDSSKLLILKDKAGYFCEYDIKTGEKMTDFNLL